MSRSFAPTRYAIARFFGRDAEFVASRASRSWQLAPAGPLTQMPPIHLDDEFERVRAVAATTTLDLEIQRLFEPETLQAASEVFEFSRVSVLDGIMYRGPARQVLDAGSEPSAWPIADVVRHGDGVFCSNTDSVSQLAHWLMDQLAAEPLAEQIGAPAVAVESAFKHAEAYRQASGLRIRSATRAYFKRLYIPVEAGLNPSRVARQRALRDRLQNALSQPLESPPVVLLASKQNQMAQEMAEQLNCQSAILIDPDELSLSQLAGALSHADCVVSDSDDHLAHALALAKPGSALLSIQSAEAFESRLKPYADALGLRYAFFVRDPATDATDSDRLDRLIERVQQELFASKTDSYDANFA